MPLAVVGSEKRDLSNSSFRKQGCTKRRPGSWHVVICDGLVGGVVNNSVSDEVDVILSIARRHFVFFLSTKPVMQGRLVKGKSSVIECEQ